jgi:hypothetical protein
MSRLAGALQAVVGISVGAALFFFVSRVAGTIVMTIGIVILLAALLSPNGFFLAISWAFGALGRWVGRALTWFLISLVFWTFFVPFGLLFRRGRRDTMKRFYETDADTYWTNREGEAAASRERRRPF